MPARFCSQCGSKTAPQANFCSACGAPLGGGAPAAAPRRTSGTGIGVFGAFVIAGLGIWAAILSPEPAPPALGGGAPPPMAGAAAPAMGEKQKVELPPDVVKMVSDLATKAEAKPDDLGLWTHLGEVYYRTAQFDDAYYPKALGAFDHVLERDPKRADALRGKANVYYDQNEPKEAIPLYERYLALKGDDLSARTDLATMYFFDGDVDRAIGMYKAVLAKDPHFVQAHYNLAAAYHQQGDLEGALAELRTAREFATDEQVRGQIDGMIARLSGAPAPASATTANAGAPPPAATAPAAPSGETPYQQAVEQALRAHQILGPKIAEVRWPQAGVAEVRLRGFPMDQMPPWMRQQFEQRLAGYMTEARAAHPVDGPLEIALVDAASGATMATVTP